jgi:YfiH family protein
MPAAEPAPSAVRSSLLAALAGVRHGFFGREGGVSTGIYASLNAGAGSQDDPQAVAQNRARIAAAFGLSPDRLLSPHQVHSAEAIVVDGPWQGERPRVDGLVTRCPNLAVSALAADCAPVLFADATARVVAAAHAGWRGALAGVLDRTVAAMVRAGAAKTRIVAAIGPCIAQASYEVGPEFEEAFLRDDDANARFFLAGAGDRRHFDLKAYCAARLRAAGVAAVDVLPDDTCAEEARYFSNRRAFRRAEGDYGRNLSVIALAPIGEPGKAKP